MTKIRALIAAVALALVSVAGTGTASADSADAYSWWYCGMYRPHAGDTLYPGQNYWHWMAPGVVTARCLAYEGPYSAPTRLHYYHVTVWLRADGSAWKTEWTPVSWATW